MAVIKTLGYKETGTPQNFASVIASQQRAYIPDPVGGGDIIFYEMGAKLGKDGSSAPTARMGIGNTSNNKTSGSPDDRITYTDAFSPNTVMSGIGGGATIVKPLQKPFIGKGTRAYALVITSTNHDLGIGMIESAALTHGEDNRNFFTKSNGSSFPTDPIGGSPSIQGWLDLWATGVVNEKPNKPTGITPSGNVASGDLTPLITSNFSDPNQTLPNGVAFDYVNQVQVIVQRVSDSVVMWDFTYTATQGERDADVTSIEYAGLSLSAGVQYRTQIRHMDRAGAWSLSSDWVTFTINPGGSIVVTVATPTGKQNSTTPGPFVAQWTHVTPLNAKAVRVVIRDASGTIKYGSPTSGGYTLGAQVTNGNNISVTYAQLGFAALPRGFVGTWEMLGQDTANTWSPASARVPFSINATPSVPVDMQPVSPWTSASLPLFKAKGVDADDPASALTATLEIKRADNSTVTRNMPYNATTGYHEYQSIFSTDFQSIYQTVSWRVKMGDGTSESAYSAYRTYIYGPGPVSAITDPVDEAVITTSGYRLAWNVTSGGPQVKKRVYVTEVDGSDNPIVGGWSYDSGLVTSANMYEDLTGLRNGRRYSAYVEVTNGTPLTASSLPIQFTTAFTPPDMPSGFSADPIALNAATGSDAVLLSFNESTYPASSFRGLYIWRTALGGSKLGERKLLRKITNPAQTSFVDSNIESGVMYEYEAYQVIATGLDFLTSVSAFSTVSIDVHHVVLSSALLAETYGVELRAKSGKGAYLDSSLNTGAKKVYPVGGRVGRSIRSTRFDWSENGAFELLTDSYQSATEKLKRLEELIEFGGTLNLRDFNGLQRYMTVDSLKVARHSSSRFTVTLGLSEEYFVEGEADVSI